MKYQNELRLIPAEDEYIWNYEYNYIDEKLKWIS